MKKIIRFSLLFLLISALVPVGVCEESDPFDPEYVHSFFGDYSIEELLNMKKLVEIELEYRGYNEKEHSNVKEVNVPVGKYTIGKDIPANTYTIKHNGMVMSMVTIYDAKGKFVTMYTISASAPIGKCELTDGQTIEIAGEPVIFTAYEGLGF